MKVIGEEKKMKAMEMFESLASRDPRLKAM